MICVSKCGGYHTQGTFSLLPRGKLPQKVKITICDSDQTVYFSNTYGNFQFLKSCFINLLHKTLSEPIFIVTVMVASYSGLEDCLYRIKKQKIVPDFLKCHEGRVSTNENMKLDKNKLDKNRFQ